MKRLSCCVTGFFTQQNLFQINDCLPKITGKPKNTLIERFNWTSIIAMKISLTASLCISYLCYWDCTL